MEERITAAYGSEVTNEVKALYEYAVRRPVDWTRETHDQATARVATEIGDAYPFLTAKAIERLAKCFWYVRLFSKQPQPNSAPPAHERDRHPVGANAVAREAPGGGGGVEKAEGEDAVTGLADLDSISQISA